VWRNLTDGNIPCLVVDEHSDSRLEISLGSKRFLMDRIRDFDGRARQSSSSSSDPLVKAGILNRAILSEISRKK
jgi:hypothetical protein